MSLCSSFSIDRKWKLLPAITDVRTDNTNNNNQPRKKRKVDGKIPVISRTVPLGNNQISSVTIWELQNPSKLMEMWWSADVDPTMKISKEKIGDPFGVVYWPGSILASQELIKHADTVANSTVLVLGAGTGVEVQVSAQLNAKKVIATDISSLTLKLLKYGAEQAGLEDRIETLKFDLYSKEKLPECDIMVAADVLYNEELARQIGLRCIEVLSRPDPPKVLVTDSQRFHGTDFISEINAELNRIDKHLEWDFFLLQNVTGSGVMIEGDQTYDAKIRMISNGWTMND